MFAAFVCVYSGGVVSSIEDRTVLNNGIEMPWLGFGVFQISDGPEVEQAVKDALDSGYRSIDTAATYGNERGVGKAIKESGIAREEIFLTTKVWNEDQRQKRTLVAFDESLERLGTDYVDLYLVHWPVKGCYPETWQAMQQTKSVAMWTATWVTMWSSGPCSSAATAAPTISTLPAPNQVPRSRPSAPKHRMKVVR